MIISKTIQVCEGKGVKTARHVARLVALVLCASTCAVWAQTNQPPVTNSLSTNSTPRPAAATTAKSENSSFSIITERNIFNANRSGGQVRMTSTRRTPRVESFTLVGTMAYEKGVFAFFDGSSSEFSKVLKANGVIAGHKLVDILSSGVKLEADGKQFDLHVGSQMQREDEGRWHVAEASTRSSSEGSSYAATRSSEGSSRSSRSDRDSSRRRSSDDRSSSRSERSESTNNHPTTTNSGASNDDVLKRLMERRDKE